MITYLYRYMLNVLNLTHPHGYVLGSRLLVTPTVCLEFISVRRGVMYSGVWTQAVSSLIPAQGRNRAIIRFIPSRRVIRHSRYRPMCFLYLQRWEERLR